MRMKTLFFVSCTIVASTMAALGQARLTNVTPPPVKQDPSEGVQQSPAVPDVTTAEGCKAKNIRYVVGTDGQRHPVPALTDAAGYVWQNGKCEISGGLIISRPPHR